MRSRQVKGERIANSLRAQRQIHGFAKGLRERVWKWKSRRNRLLIGSPEADYVHSAKGLTFDTVLAARGWSAGLFPYLTDHRLASLLFVGRHPRREVGLHEHDGGRQQFRSVLERVIPPGRWWRPLGCPAWSSGRRLQKPLFDSGTSESAPSDTTTSWNPTVDATWPIDHGGQSSSGTARTEWSQSVNSCVDQARQGLIRKLIDLSGATTSSTSGTSKRAPSTSVPRPNGEPGQLASGTRLARTLASVSLLDLVPADDERRPLEACVTSSVSAIANYEERGLETLFLALGLATWLPAMMVVQRQRLSVAANRCDCARTRGTVLADPPNRRGARQSRSPLRAGSRARADSDPEQIIEEIQGDEEGETFDLNPAFDRL